MPSANFECPKCNCKALLNWPVGSKPIKMICKKCNTEMKRIFGEVGLGSVVEDHMLYAADTMLHGKLPSGKDKIVY